MPITRETPLGDLAGYYRTTLVAALRVYEKAVAKARKDEEDISGVTDHLDDMDEIVEEFRACLGVSNAAALENTPLGRAMQAGATKHGDPHQLHLDTADVNLMDDSVIIMMLDIVHYNADPAGIAALVTTWNEETRREVYRWSRTVQLIGSTSHVKIPDRPSVVRAEWLDPALHGAIEQGRIDPQTMEPLGDMSEEDIARWIQRGPWESRACITDGENMFGWTLGYNGVVAEGEAPPAYDFTHPDEADARRVAAIINRRLASERGETGLGMSQAEQVRWIQAGPWGAFPAIDAGIWWIRWNDPTERDVLPPTRTETFTDGDAALLAVAELNKAEAVGGSPSLAAAMTAAQPDPTPAGETEPAPTTGGDMEEIADAEQLAKKRGRKRRPKGGGSKGT